MCALLVMTIGSVHEEIYAFGKKKKVRKRKRDGGLQKPCVLGWVMMIGPVHHERDNEIRKVTKEENRGGWRRGGGGRGK